ncbi:hypothetical protein NQZ68_004582 [Dissostichus eleginoides]|nr:hypothetical protein NQZ68_004582 [Dissostichus eleginoides]
MARYLQTEVVYWVSQRNKSSSELVLRPLRSHNIVELLNSADLVSMTDFSDKPSQSGNGEGVKHIEVYRHAGITNLMEACPSPHSTLHLLAPFRQLGYTGERSHGKAVKLAMQLAVSIGSGRIGGLFQSKA